MNVSNLQLQGLYLAVAAINNALVSKGCYRARKSIRRCGDRSRPHWATTAS